MRDFLNGLELDKETVDTIMAEYGKRVQGFKEKVEGYEEEIKGYKSTIEENTKSLENLQTMTNENKDLKAQVQMNGSNVKKEFEKFVQSEVNSLVDDETDFATALEDYKKSNPQYFGDTVVKKVQSSPILNNGGQQPVSTNDIMNNILRGANKND